MLQLDGAATIKERPVMTNSDNGQAREQPPTPGPEIRPMEPNERIIRANGVDLCVQTFGDRADPPILLIMGGAASMDWWEDGFCERLMVGSRFVIRYDHRDTGRSVSYEPGTAPYSLRDLAEDAVGLLHVFELIMVAAGVEVVLRHDAPGTPPFDVELQFHCADRCGLPVVLGLPCR